MTIRSADDSLAASMIWLPASPSRTSGSALYPADFSAVAEATATAACPAASALEVSSISWTTPGDGGRIQPYQVGEGSPTVTTRTGRSRKTDQVTRRSRAAAAEVDPS